MQELLNLVRQLKNNETITGYSTVIESSIQIVDESVYFLLKNDGSKRLGVYAPTQTVNDFKFIDSIEDENYILGIGELSEFNYEAMLDRFDWMNARSRVGTQYSFGLGDRLGIASQAHLNLFKDKDVLPVLAQQSIRELMLTGRTFKDVIMSAAWAVFETGYTKGFAADGDHLKHAYEVEYAVNAGFPMITLDCSEHINDSVINLDDASLKAYYESKVSQTMRDYYASEYLGRVFEINGVEMRFTERILMETVLTYAGAIYHSEEIYHDFVIPHSLDFEVSIDETAVPTTPENHYFIANEFSKKDIKVVTLAPRFCGEFQKAIDYIGNLEQFEEEYNVHEKIAQHFGYKLSIHSGSDKFSVFPIIGRLSERGWHVKTAGTNWLEALRVIAMNDSEFMNEIYTYAINALDKAKQYYVIDATKETAPKASDFVGDNAVELLNNDTTRQILHVTFGLILNERKDGEYVFKDKIYSILEENYDDYQTVLNAHIGKHLELLGV